MSPRNHYRRTRRAASGLQSFVSHDTSYFSQPIPVPIFSKVASWPGLPYFLCFLAGFGHAEVWDDMRHLLSVRPVSLPNGEDDARGVAPWQAKSKVNFGSPGPALSPSWRP